MIFALSPNTQAILLLTAPLIVGRNSEKPDLLSSGEYKRLARCLREIEHEPADLLSSNSAHIFEACKQTVDPERLRRLLGRGFQLSQAVERWQTRAIWVVSRADAEYPHRLKMRLRGDAPAVLFGCGEVSLLDQGGLAVVGSRHVKDSLIDYTMAVGHLAAASGKPIVSGGARGIDQAAMRGALEAGGRVSGVLADSLEKKALNREHRNMLLDGRLTLISPYDPNAGFNVGNAMQRNKLIYALADAALVVSSDVNKGGTWAGAIEQLDKRKLVQVYVRSTGEPSAGLTELQNRGALSWPDPNTSEALEEILEAPMVGPDQEQLSLNAIAQGKENIEREPLAADVLPTVEDPLASDAIGGKSLNEPATAIEGGPAEKLFEVARKSIELLARSPMAEAEIADALKIEKSQAKSWLNRLIEMDVLEKTKRPVRYVKKEKTFL